MTIEKEIKYIKKTQKAIENKLQLLKDEHSTETKKLITNVDTFTKEVKTMQTEQNNKIKMLSFMHENSQKKNDFLIKNLKKDSDMFKDQINTLLGVLIDHITESKNISSKFDTFINKVEENTTFITKLKHRIVPAFALILVLVMAYPSASKKIYDIIKNDIIQQVWR